MDDAQITVQYLGGGRLGSVERSGIRNFTAESHRPPRRQITRRRKKQKKTAEMTKADVAGAEAGAIVRK